ncbi:MAG: complex I NDUFA9 subunit family protein [Epsilonproteobacteria bacterium]|nr:complex I NDUFA9 subunit family protein [Campylobacterota bacterium]
MDTNSKIHITSGGFVAKHLKRAFKDNLCESIEKADIVINTVGILKEGKYTYDQSHINVIKELIPKVKNKKFIHLSALGSRLNHKSRYKHTKAKAEELIKQNLTNYAIIKPSIILGEGQKLYEDLSKFKNLPIILAPKMKVAPVDIQKLISLIKDIISRDLRGEFELCGKEMSMRELFLEVFESFGKKPLVIEMPKWYFRLLLPILSRYDILSKDEYLMIEDNVCGEKNG